MTFFIVLPELHQDIHDGNRPDGERAFKMRVIQTWLENPPFTDDSPFRPLWTKRGILDETRPCFGSTGNAAPIPKTDHHGPCGSILKFIGEYSKVRKRDMNRK